MAPRPKAVPAWDDIRDPFTGEPFSFPVTVRAVIGRISVGEGEHAPHEAAFLLIARHDEPGVYEFPMANGGVCTVEVTHTDPE